MLVGRNAGGVHTGLSIRERQLAKSGWRGLNPRVRLNIQLGEMAQTAVNAELINHEVHQWICSCNLYGEAFDYRSLLSPETRKRLEGGEA
jgi:hypothetical protein